MSFDDLPTHPVTGLRALGIVGGRPVWPVLGGSEDTVDPSSTIEPTTDGDQINDPDGTDPSRPVNRFGYPDNTPLAEMNEAEKLAYWRRQARKHEADADALRGGVTADEAAQLRSQIAELQAAALTDEQRQSAQELDQARTEALAAARAELLPQLRHAQLLGYASIVLGGDQRLDQFMAVADPAAFLGEDGHIDGERVVSHLNALFGTQSTTTHARTHPNFGQGSNGGAPKPQRGASGRAEAEKRFGAMNS